MTILIYIPIAIAEKSLNSKDSSVEIKLSDTLLDNYSKAEITNSAMASFNQLNWKDENESLTEVKSEYVKLVADAQKSQRVKDLAMKLFLSNNYQTI